MRTLFLFFTQAEGGAKQYLSRRGEDAAENLAESLAQFLTGTLALDLTQRFDARVQSLDEDLRWRGFKKQESLRAAAEAALALEPDVLMLSGADWRSLKTAEAIATQLALPVCVDEKLDGDRDKKQPTLSDALTEWEHWLAGWPTPPKVVLVGTSLVSLGGWLQTQLDPEKYSQTQQILAESTQQDTIPAVFAAGFSESDGRAAWIFD